MSTITTIEDLALAYRNGQRHFTDLEIETGEVVHGLDLRGAKIENSYFMLVFNSCTMRYLTFKNCNLKTCSFINCDFTGAMISNCAVEHVTFNNCMLEKFVFDENYCYSGIAGMEHLKDFIE